MSGFWECTACGDILGSLGELHACRGRPEHPVDLPLHDIVDRIVSDRLRSIVERLKVNADGPLVPEAEVYVRTVVARAIEEELEER